MNQKLKLNETAIAALPAPVKGNRLHYFAGAVIQGGTVPRGFAVKVQANGVRTFVLRYAMAGADRLFTIGRVGDWTCLNAVKQARTLRQAIDRGEDPLAARARATARASGQDTVKAICEEWARRKAGMKRDAGGNATFSGALRSAPERVRTFERLVYPKLGSTPIEELTRTEIIRLLDGIEDDNGPVMADRTLSYVRCVFNWHASRSDSFNSPIVRGMARTKASERARERVLEDLEIIAVWKATAKPTPFNRVIRFLLLTGARRSEAAELAWAELAEQPVDAMASKWQMRWTLPPSRNKTKLELVRPLSAAAVAALPARAGTFVFSHDDGVTPVSADSGQMLARLHKASATSGWTLHDLRRTARTLMSRAGVPSDTAERCLGHVIGGVRGVYDRHTYVREMADAYERLATLIDNICDPRQKVTPLRSSR